MKAWHFTGTNEPLERVEKENPTIEEGRIIIETKAGGLCHSDVGVLRDPGWLDIMGDLPIVMGHEVAGEVIEVADDVEDFKVGDRVAVTPTGPSGAGAPGYFYDGGFGSRVMAPAVDCVKIPDGVTYAQAAAATDAGMTSYHATFTKGGVEEGMTVGMIGIGGLGQIALEAAVSRGATVYAVDTNPKARELAEKLGAKDTFEDVSEIAEFEPEVIIDFAGFDVTTSGALNAVGFQGKVVLVGMGKLETTINVTNMITKQSTLVGSNGGTKQDVEDILQMFANDEIHPIVTEIDFEEIPKGIQMLEDGEVTGRLVALYD